MRGVHGGGRTTLGVVCVALVVVLAGCSVSVDLGTPDGGFDHPDVEDAHDPDDSDDDGLNDSLEAEAGIDPNVSDTDGDRLLDGWEYHGETDDRAALPDADPLHKDVYVQVNYAQGIQPLGEEERRNLTAIWAGMNVSNPDGERGITLHVDDESPHGGQVNVSRTFESRPTEFIDQQYDWYVPDRRKCIYHGTTFVEAGDVEFGGYGSTPGYESVIVGQLEGRTSADTWGSYNRRASSLTHELLHNIAGNVTDGDDPGHSGSRGWLAGSYVYPDNESEWSARYERLSRETSRALSERGFAEYDRRFHEACH
jgi:hypothetical protein